MVENIDNILIQIGNGKNTYLCGKIVSEMDMNH